MLIVLNIAVFENIHIFCLGHCGSVSRLVVRPGIVTLRSRVQNSEIGTAAPGWSESSRAPRARFDQSGGMVSPYGMIGRAGMGGGGAAKLSDCCRRGAF